MRAKMLHSIELDFSIAQPPASPILQSPVKTLQPPAPPILQSRMQKRHALTAAAARWGCRGAAPLVVLAVMAVMLRQAAPARRNSASDSSAPGASRCAHRVGSESTRACVGLRIQDIAQVVSLPK